VAPDDPNGSRLARGYLVFDPDRRGLRPFGRRERTLLSPLYAPLSARRTTAGLAASELGSLTRREAEVLELLARGWTNKEIAERLVLSPHTVRTHLEHSFRKLGVNTRTEAALTFLRLGKDGRRDVP